MSHLHSSRPSDRRGFTLIELLVVIAIIAILVGLTAAAVILFLGKGPELQDTSNLTQLSSAAQDFKNKFGVFPPSKITLARKKANVDAVSLNYLFAIWPKLWTGGTALIHWDGNPGGNVEDAWVLEGDQCLVFFLGGIPLESGGDFACQGFSTTPSNPAAGGGSRVGPFFNFDSARLYKRTASPFFSYRNPYPVEYAQPYLYFSSGRRENGYDLSHSITVAQGDPPSPFTVSPFFEFAGPPTRYLNPKSFQIISAGPDGLFGPGGQWTAQNAFEYAGTDDRANFHHHPLGVTGN